ncbi:uncharacterized protein [Venturia canescens]|uniref:uncharacterized protein n=1 Tax=Venturia canescens TaxID=32260 RepID=UPI001C9C3CF9|nr:uncharacterized protein LOC122415854 [Venturia canescens]
MNVGLQILFTWLINGLYQNRLKLIVERFVQAEGTSRKLNIPENYEEHFGKLGQYLLIVNGGWFILIIVNIVGLSGFPDYNASLWTSYNLLRIPSFNSVTTFLWSILVVKRKFYRLNEKVRFLMVPFRNKSFVLEENACSELIRNSKHSPAALPDTIDAISQHRRNLIKVTKMVKRHFDFLVLLCIVAHMPTCVVNIYLAYKTVKEDEPMTGSNWFYTFSYICWFFFPIFTLLVISNVCGSTTNEANETGNVLHAMLNGQGNFGDSREVAKFNMFSLELLQNPVEMSLFGFVDLNHWMVYKVLTTAITYLVIMLQFYN